MLARRHEPVAVLFILSLWPEIQCVFGICIQHKTVTYIQVYDVQLSYVHCILPVYCAFPEVFCHSRVIGACCDHGLDFWR